ncbi:MucB/RseB C-terminal domain-containing protein [Thiocapsa bogorovii]|uniref:MucB/RseB C-terminal domain-containing protein n=1 Tax=Thiocapsa bogorovii TaxID=521689 RepID=UPI001E544D62|nr:MucB/RseB C-terminal domain-containing protein [Thiocapsa bogorovii]UHD17016.1 MucB/RseB C-terminal domain-containing protein [Thiocapsa bogorovii]
MKRVADSWLPARLGIFFLLALVVQASLADDVIQRASDLLQRMADALKSLNYEGTLVYSHENRLEALHLVHRYEEGQVQERLLSLNGPVRAVTREPDRVMCVLPDGHPISVKRPSGAGGLLNTDGIFPEHLGDHYRIEIQGIARVAGRDTEVVGIIPRDDLRYGYRFYVDQETFLPLKSDLIDSNGASLEQLMFTAITVDGNTPTVSARVEESGLRGAPVAPVEGRWRFDEPPVGFQLVSQGVMDNPSGALVEHFLFTDRLSAYSIYIEDDTRDGLRGSTHIGAVHAAGRQIDGYQITAVGEVPPETVEAAVLSVRRVDDPSD